MVSSKCCCKLSSAPTAAYASAPLTSGLLDGYMTMDSIAALAFGIVVVTSLERTGGGIGAKMVRRTSVTALIAGALLALVYVGLGLIGHVGAQGVGRGGDLRLLGISEPGRALSILRSPLSSVQGMVGVVGDVVGPDVCRSALPRGAGRYGVLLHRGLPAGFAAGGLLGPQVLGREVVGDLHVAHEGGELGVQVALVVLVVVATLVGSGGLVHHRLPFVDGMVSTRGSSSTAARRARARALNSASAMWWGSRPDRTRTCRQMPAW